MSAPVIVDPRPLFQSDDIPQHIRAPATTLTVLTRTTVRPDGKAQDCSAEQSSGDAKVDDYTCALLLKRRKFSAAAVWPDGSPAYGVIRLAIVWGSAPPLSRSPADLDVTLSKLPEGMSSPAFASVSLAADERGHVVSCAGKPLGSLLVQLACDEIVNVYTAIPAKDDAGNPVRSIQTAVVRFNKSDTRTGSVSKHDQ